MTIQHDFKNARRGAVIKGAGKTRVTMYLDDDVIEFFRQRATENGRGYQTEINTALRSVLGESDETGSILRGQMDELVRAVGRIERTVKTGGGYAEHRAGPRSTVREEGTGKPKRGAS